MDEGLEISVIHKIFNAILFLFILNNNNELHLLQINININNCIILALCFLNNEHYNILYENVNNINNNKIEKNIILNDNIINNVVNLNMKKQIFIKLNIIYANDNRKIQYTYN